MTKYLMNVSASLIAIIVASNINTHQPTWKNEDRFPDIFLVYYSTSGYQGSLSNYYQQSMPPLGCTGSIKLCWFKADDLDFDGAIDDVEFSMAFNYLDNNCNGSLNDELEIPSVLEKRF